MALELSKQAFELCREQDAPGLRAFLEEHPDVVVLLHEEVEYDAGTSYNIISLAAWHEPPESLRVLLDFGVEPERRFGYTPLMEPSASRVECMRLLLEEMQMWTSRPTGAFDWTSSGV
jgi:hypothetical protein